MRIARIFLHKPAGFSFDVALADQQTLGALTYGWRSDGFILVDNLAGPFTKWDNVALIVVYEAPTQTVHRQDPGQPSTVVSFPFQVPQPPKEPA